MRRIILLTLLGLSLCVTGAAAQANMTAVLDTVEHAAFNYFWYEANPVNGLIRDRSEAGSPASIAANGFGFSAICIGVDRGWVSRSDASDRVLTAMQTFWNGPQGTATSGTIGYKGLFYHFLDMNTATRTWTSELSTIDTGLLLAGILDARQYFTGTDPREVQIRALADSIYYRMDWDWTRNSTSGIKMGWTPESGFLNFGTWIGYNEAMVMYLEAIGSPTHPAPAYTWSTWISGYQWQTWYGYTYVAFAPLFGHQYSHCWMDFRVFRDNYMKVKGITYFTNSEYATRAARAYCMANPGGFTGYGDSLWGLTASDDPVVGYNAHGAPPAQNDNGTLSPTAATSSLPFAPDICIPAIRNMYQHYPLLWGAYGFRDAFNLNPSNSPGHPWYDPDFLGIDQGPIVMMVENYRTGSVWNRWWRDDDIQRGLSLATFRAVNAVEPGAGSGLHALYQNAPNPFRGTTTLRYRLGGAGPVKLRLFDASGRQVALLVNATQAVGEHAAVLDARTLGSGVYTYRLDAGGESLVKKCVLLK